MVAGREQCECWFIDSGASSHMTSDRNFFVSLDEKPGPNVILADGKIAATAGCGEGVVMCVDGNGEAIKVKLCDVPSLTSGLVSADKLTAKEFKVKFRKDGCSICDASEKVVVVGEQSGSLYKLKLAIERKVNMNRDLAVISKVVERKSEHVLDFVHTDLCGPMRTTTPGGK